MPRILQLFADAAQMMEPGIRIGLQRSGEVLELPLRMLVLAIGRVGESYGRCRRIT
jgi:hypothetical protein